MTDLKSNRRFPLGRIVMSRAVMDHIPAEEVWKGIQHHVEGDEWNELWRLFDAAAIDRATVFSVHRTRNDERIWIITECHRSLTTVLLLEED